MGYCDQCREVRRRVIKSIRAMVEPRLRPAPSLADNLRLVTFGIEDGEFKVQKVANALSIDDSEFLGFTANGIITDATAGGCSIQTYDQICLDDLCQIHTIVRRLKDKDYE